MGVDLDEGDRVAAQHMGWGNIGWAYLVAAECGCKGTQVAWDMEAVRVNYEDQGMLDQR